jgi:hypothetical protein
MAACGAAPPKVSNGGAAPRLGCAFAALGVDPAAGFGLQFSTNAKRCDVRGRYTLEIRQPNGRVVARQAGGYVVSAQRHKWATAVLWSWINWCGDRGRFVASLHVGDRRLVADVAHPPKCLSRKYPTRLDRIPLKTAILPG